MNEKLTVLDLKNICIDVRRDILDENYFYGGSGHLGGSLSIVEILVCLFFITMNIKPDQPDWSQRDRFVLSKGHAAQALYAAMSERGFFPKEELKSFGKDNSRLQKHLDMHKLPGIDVSSGSLGQGLSIAIGMTLADAIDKKNRYVYCLIGDGESQEGQIWEAAMAAGHHKLDKLIVFLDCNKMQVDGFTKDILDIEPLRLKWESFKWYVQRIDGHNINQILTAIKKAKANEGRPNIIISDTVKGKGIDFIENQIEWHSHATDEDQYKNGIAQLDYARKCLINKEN